MPKEKRERRQARNSSPYGASASEVAANRNPRSTRRNGDAAARPPAADPQMPRELWKGERPGWTNEAAIWASFGGKGTATCAKSGCSAVAEELDHKVDWRTHIYNECSQEELEVSEGVWTGFLLADVKAAYSDLSNLQPMCQPHNGSKSGPKFYDKERPSFKRK